MLELGSLAFAAPWMLLAAAALPVLWWLLRVTPPSPRQMAFPPLRLLLALRSQEETPARTPLWLVLLRMLLAALIIAAVAHPLWNPGAALRGNGPLILVIDDGWAAALRWPARQAATEALIDRAERQGRPVLLLSTAPTAPDKPVAVSKLLRASDARQTARALSPQPWPSDRRAALAALEALTIPGSAHVVWLSDGLAGGADDDLVRRLVSLGSLQVMTEPAEATARLIGAPDGEAGALVVPVIRAGRRGEAPGWLRAMGVEGRMLARERIAFKDGEAVARVRLELPGELRNAVTRLEIEDEQTAGAVFLLDERWRRRPVGLVSGDASEADQPLLSSLYFLERALKPFSEIRRATLATLLERELAVLVLADLGKLGDTRTAKIVDWMSAGGVVVRFAGPKLARAASGLIPVSLRGGGRALGGTMSWSRPAALAPFGEASPFAGLVAPEDVLIRRQVLAEPTLDLDAKTWARLRDGTPLVTADRRGDGWLILFHTTASTAWSNLPLSGLFVNMLRRIVGLSRGVVGDDAAAVHPPLETLDGRGHRGQPPSFAVSIQGRAFAEARAAPRTPPGYYGREAARRALNLSAGMTALTPLAALPTGVERRGYDSAAALDFKPWLLLAALVLAIIDLVIGFALRGLLPRPTRRGAAVTTVALLAVLAALAAPAMAQTAPVVGGVTAPAGPDAKALLATLETQIAYVRNGDARVDEISRAGLAGLARMLHRRTAVEPGAPLGVDVECDELAFFPLLYWAVSPRQRPLSERATERLNQYLRTGGTILFDIRERGDFNTDSFGRGGAASQRLRMLLRGFDIPALIPVPRDHVMTKAFYLLSDFPGRWTGGTLWVERRGGRHNDGVSSVMIGTNDWAGAWAVDEFGAAMFPVVPGGDIQREMAFRFGINWVMYALTGNYKTDQVHVPAIIERLGQ